MASLVRLKTSIASVVEARMLDEGEDVIVDRKSEG